MHVHLKVFIASTSVMCTLSVPACFLHSSLYLHFTLCSALQVVLQATGGQAGLSGQTGAPAAPPVEMDSRGDTGRVMGIVTVMESSTKPDNAGTNRVV